MLPAAEMKNASHVLRAGDLIQALIHRALVKDGTRGDTSKLSAPARAIVESIEDSALILRGAVAAGSTDSDSPANWASGLAAYRNGAHALLKMLHSGYFDNAVRDMRPGALHSDFSVMVSQYTGVQGAEGQWKSVNQFAVTGARMEARKALMLAALTDVLIRLGDAGPLISAVLRDGTISGTDQIFITALLALATPTPSSGSAVSDVFNDCAAALAALDTSPASKLHWCASPATVKNLIAMGEGGNRPFANLTPAGGAFMGGDIRASDHVGTSVILVDASGFTGNAGELIVDVSRNADIALDNALSGNSAKQIVSMFQVNGACFRAERFFGFEPLREGAVAILSDVAWGNPESPGSPA